MSEPITHEEACETVQKVVELLDTVLDASEPWRAIGTAQGLLANVHAALSSCACGGQKAREEACQEHIWRHIKVCDLCGADFEEVMVAWADRAFSKEAALPTEEGRHEED